MLLLRDCSLNLNSLPHLQSSANGTDDRFCGSRHGFENGYEANRTDDDAGFENDVVVIETSLASD